MKRFIEMICAIFFSLLLWIFFLVCGIFDLHLSNDITFSIPIVIIVSLIASVVLGKFLEKIVK